MAATMIPQEAVLLKEDIEKIRESIVSLRRLVDDGSLPLELRQVLLDLIRLSEDAISHYTIRGALGLRKAFKAMLGEVGEFYAFKSDEDKQILTKSSGWKAVWKHMKTFGDFTLRVAPTAIELTRLYLENSQQSFM